MKKGSRGSEEEQNCAQRASKRDEQLQKNAHICTNLHTVFVHFCTVKIPPPPPPPVRAVLGKVIILAKRFVYILVESLGLTP